MFEQLSTKTGMVFVVACLCASVAQAQVQIKDLDINPAPAPAPASAPTVAPSTEVDLGQEIGSTAAPKSSVSVGRTSVNSAKFNAAKSVDQPTITTGATVAAKSGGARNVERAVFDRQPIRVSLPVGKERLITLPGPAALHVPDDIEAVARIESIDKTLYITALVPFAPIRIVAELIDGGRQIPIDISATAGALAVTPEFQIFLGDSVNATASKAAEQGSTEPAADMVELTRFASRMLYAPRRLAQASSAIQQVQLAKTTVPNLLRGALVDTAALGQWRSGDLYVTALRVTNKSSKSLEITLEDFRGRWLAATAQHGLIGPAGSDTDTTAVYLICDRAFESCL